MIFFSAERSDFIVSDSRNLEFKRQDGTQTQCSVIQIIQDEDEEGDEQFSIRLLSSDPAVAIQEVDSQASVTITEGNSGLLLRTSSNGMLA